MQQCACNPESFCKWFSSVPCHVSLTHFRTQSSPIFFLFTLQTQKAIGYMSGLLFTRNINSLLIIIFASFKNCALRTLWPISGLPEIMSFPYYLYRKLTPRRQSALSIVRVANPDVHGHGQGNRNGHPFRGGSRIFFRRGCTRLLLYFNTNKPHSFCFAEYQVY